MAVDYTKVALTGLKAANNSLGVISNNIANSETVGFKSNQANFKSMVAGRGSSAEGIGVRTGDISTNYESGSISPTGNSLHHAVSGDGFFIVKDSDGQPKLTRAGLFEFDNKGTLIDSSGYKVQGIIGNSELGDIVINKSPLLPEVTTSASVSLNLGDNLSSGKEISPSIKVFDSLGGEHQLKLTFGNRSFDDNTKIATWEVTADINGVTEVLGEISFDDNGQLQLDEGLLTDGKFNFDASNSGLANVGDIEIDLNKSTGFNGDLMIREQSSNGGGVAEFDRYVVEEDGKISSYFNDGRKREIGQLALGRVENINGLDTESGPYFSATSKSGDLMLGVSGQAGFGVANSGVLEGSNISTTDELVNMISAQKFFQSNSKVIGVAGKLDQAIFQAIG